jgi:adenine phosphoribosyltransferase|tara:strand:+ start:212 stop:727 length:516 start_codon:yes stop_codon:yes gene_type:complete
VNLKPFIRIVPDYPSPGILFRDITPLLASPETFTFIVDNFCENLYKKNLDALCAIDARGFIFGAPVAYKLNLPFIPLRKEGKLPPEIVSIDYSLEYGKTKLEVRGDSIKKGQKIAVVDDLLATGGSALAASKLVSKLGGKVNTYLFVIELTELKGRERLPHDAEVISLLLD